MSISSISNTPYTNAISATVTGTTSTDATSAVTGARHHHHGGGGKFMQSMLAALNQSGVSTSGASPSQSGDSSGATGTQSLQQSMQQFMHALFPAHSDLDLLEGSPCAVSSVIDHVGKGTIVALTLYL